MRISSIISILRQSELTVNFAVFSVLSVLPFSLCAAPIQAPRAIRMLGVVTDSITGERLPFANIISTLTPRENSVADENGSFRISTSGNGKGWKVSYTGYVEKPLVVTSSDTVVVVKLAPVSRDLQEVVVRPRKEKYSKKNNPAVEFVKRLRNTSKEYDPTNEPYYSYDKYEKTLLALNEFNGDLAEDGFFQKKEAF